MNTNQDLQNCHNLPLVRNNKTVITTLKNSQIVTAFYEKKTPFT